MYPLIEIKTVPIEIQMKTKHATLEYSRGTAEMEISRDDGGAFDIKSRPIKMRLDSFEPRGGGPAPAPAVSTAPAKPPVSGMDRTSQGGYEATATLAAEGDLLLSARFGQNAVPQAVQNWQPVTQQPAEMQSVSAKAVSAGEEETMPSFNFDWDGGDIQIRYEMDKMNVDWKITQGEFKFTPGDIEISVAQRPEVIIKYTGGPIYVPPSADPNYEPVDVRV